MAVLTDEQRRAAWAEMMRLGGVSITKLPQPARSGLTTPQKALLLALVVRARYNVGA